MRKNRIAAAVAGFAALAAVWAGAPSASADIVDLDIQYRTIEGSEFLVVTVKTDDCQPVYLYADGEYFVNGPLIPQNPANTPCTPGTHEGWLVWKPKKLGIYQVVAEQQDSQLNVTSTMSRHFNVIHISCDKPKTASGDCPSTSGSF
ncbi:hypothetical protein [Nocardia sp. NPDC057668]|uniref:hypothetical protein n=1 Tax=Nocardia sp. NPDC057668 TaxID=3346202 RepID=UPI003672BE49